MLFCATHVGHEPKCGPINGAGCGELVVLHLWSLPLYVAIIVGSSSNVGSSLGDMNYGVSPREPLWMEDS